MKTARIFAALAFLCLPGCSTPGSEYAKAHPELPPAHREILKNGKAPGGLAVEGMTKEQVRLALGNPTTLEHFNEGDAWIYAHESPADGPAEKEDSGMGGRGSKKAGASAARAMMVEKTTIFFHGDRATQAQISKERE
jgi:hypothetical protein